MIEIERDITPRIIILKKLIDCTLSQQRLILDIRNQDAVRKSMYTEHIISWEEHCLWLGSLSVDDKQIVFAITDEHGIPIGVLSINAIDFLHKKSDWAFYLDEQARGGLGAGLEFFAIEYVFDHLHLEKLNCEVIETNTAVVRLHQKFGFIEEGFRRSNIVKNNKRIGVYFLGLTKEDWSFNKSHIVDKYQGTFTKFSIKIDD